LLRRVLDISSIISALNSHLSMEITIFQEWPRNDDGFLTEPRGYDNCALEDAQGNICRLSISDDALLEFPQEIFSLSHLQSLTIHFAKFSTIPLGLERLQSLEEIEISSCGLEKIPAELKQLPNLEYIDFSENTISTIPPFLSKIPCLKTLYLEFNRISEVPPDAFPPSLHALDLGHNEISAIPKRNAFPSGLRHLDLSDNKISELPEDIGKLSHLKRLYLYDNYLTTLPSSFKNLLNLKILYLSNNDLSSFPSVLLHCTNLEFLSLEKNRLEAIPNEISRLSNLKCLEIYGNSFLTFPYSVLQLPEDTKIWWQRFYDSDHEEIMKEITAHLRNLTPNDVLYYVNENREIPEIILFHPKVLQYRDFLLRKIKGNDSKYARMLRGYLLSYKNPNLTILL
jgi:Leucine-rich repeat (LRR) protein